MYLGLRSLRMEMAKTNTWIKENDTELMRLQLQSWYGKGFVKLYSQHPDYSLSEDILKKYINYDSVKVRKLFLHSPGSVTSNDTVYEHTDSTFYDITLLRDKDRTMDSIVYIGITNRRTDPLIYFNDTSAAAWYMKFYPTDELDSLVTSADSSEFQQLWWRRLGCRKITLPFDYKDADKHYALLKIKSLARMIRYWQPLLRIEKTLIYIKRLIRLLVRTEDLILLSCLVNSKS
ncbi:MAG: hypothetical protein IPM69_15440 [Ignavibacteria bacterium]|nr:hypothetical protein [Ignavibacteria bacterium]